MIIVLAILGYIAAGAGFSCLIQFFDPEDAATHKKRNEGEFAPYVVLSFGWPLLGPLWLAEWAIETARDAGVSRKKRREDEVKAKERERREVEDILKKEGL